jgi:hypothetical protein
VVLLGWLGNGLGYYRFAYNGSEKAYVGVIAQEVSAVRPDAVAGERDGYLRVFYEKLGLRFQSYDDWVASGARLPEISAMPALGSAAVIATPSKQSHNVAAYGAIRSPVDPKRFGIRSDFGSATSTYRHTCHAVLASLACQASCAPDR